MPVHKSIQSYVHKFMCGYTSSYAKNASLKEVEDLSPNKRTQQHVSKRLNTWKANWLSTYIYIYIFISIGHVLPNPSIKHPSLLPHRRSTHHFSRPTCTTPHPFHPSSGTFPGGTVLCVFPGRSQARGFQRLKRQREDIQGWEKSFPCRWKTFAAHRSREKKWPTQQFPIKKRVTRIFFHPRTLDLCAAGTFWHKWCSIRNPWKVDGPLSSSMGIRWWIGAHPGFSKAKQYMISGYWNVKSEGSFGCEPYGSTTYLKHLTLRWNMFIWFGSTPTTQDAANRGSHEG